MVCTCVFSNPACACDWGTMLCRVGRPHCQSGSETDVQWSKGCNSPRVQGLAALYSILMVLSTGVDPSPLQASPC